MKKSEQIELIAKVMIEQLGSGSPTVMKKYVLVAVGCLEQKIQESLMRGDNVDLLGLATIKVKDTPARIGRNPRTGEKTDIPAGKRVSIKPGKGLKDAVKI